MKSIVDFGDIRGQEAAKRAMLIAIAGGHDIVLIGPSGHGKTMMIWAAMAVGARTQRIAANFHEMRPVKADFVPSDEMLNAEIHVEVPPVPYRDLTGKSRGTDSAYVVKQLDSMAAYSDLTLSDESLLLGGQAYEELGLSARSFQAAVRVARTIANLRGSERILAIHFAEALQYRLLADDSKRRLVNENEKQIATPPGSTGRRFRRPELDVRGPAEAGPAPARGS